MTSKTMYFQSIGDVVFQCSERSRRIRISIKPTRGVLVTYPPNVRFKDVLNFTLENSEWIQKHVNQAKAIENKRTIYKPGIIFSTREHSLQFVQDSEQNMILRINHGHITVHYATEEQILSDKGQELIRKGIAFALRKEAKKLLPERIHQLSKSHDLPFKDLRIKDLRSRWGSCSSLNNINLNIHLVRLPDHLIDYVILHELAHTREKNHGKGFWKLLDSMTGNAKNLAKEMKAFRTQDF